MGYIEKNLLDNETLVYLTRRHKIIFTFPVIWLTLSVAAYAYKSLGHYKPEIDMVFFPHYRADAEFCLEKLSAAQTGMALMSCLVNARNLSGDGFPATVELARKVPAFRLMYPDFTGVVGTITGLLEEL